jgi:phosphatidylinositol 4-kinase
MDVGIDDAAEKVHTAYPSSRSRTTDVSSSWLLRLFRSDFFDAWMAVTYLYRYRLARGVFDYICNELYNLDMEDIELYLPQLGNLLVFHSKETNALEKFVMDRCAESMHFALQVYWFLQAAGEDNRNRAMLKRCQLLRTRCETAAVNGYADTVFVGSPTAAAELIGYDFTPIRAEDASATEQSMAPPPPRTKVVPATAEWANSLPNMVESHNSARDRSETHLNENRHKRAHSLSTLATQDDSAQDAKAHHANGHWKETAGHTQDQPATSASPAHARADAGALDEPLDGLETEAAVRRFVEQAVNRAAERLSGIHLEYESLSAGESDPPRSVPACPAARQWPPSALDHTRLLAAKQERFDYFNDMLYFFRSLVRLSLDLRTISPSKREKMLRSRLDALSGLVYRRIAGVEGRPTRLGAQDVDVTAEQVAPHCPRAALRSIHLPLSRSNESVLRLLRIAAGECTILSSKDRVPYMVFAEVLETNMKCSDRNVFCQHLASEDRLREMEALLYTASPAHAILPDDVSFEPVEVVRLDEIISGRKDCRARLSSYDPDDGSMTTALDETDPSDCTVSMASPDRPPVYAAPSRLLPRYAHRLPAGLGSGCITCYSDLLDTGNMLFQRSRSLSNETVRRLQFSVPGSESTKQLASTSSTRNANEISDPTNAVTESGAQNESDESGQRRLDPRALQRQLVREAIEEKMHEKHGGLLPRINDHSGRHQSSRHVIRGSGFVHSAPHVPRGVNFREKMGARQDEDSERKSREATLLAVYGEMWEWKEARVRVSSPFGHLPTWRLASFIVKAGDDLRQEQLAVQLIDQMLRIFEEESLPLWLRPFTIVCVGNNAGLVETIPDAVSVHSLKKRTPNFISLREYFERAYGAPESAAFLKAVRNFTESMAGYSLATYLFQVRDRHNGNIMLAASGHVIHIDFGFMLGNSPGSIRFEAAPFKLSPEYLDVMGGVHSDAFRYFRELFVSGFLACRKHYEKLTTLIEIMLEGTRLPCMAGGMAVVDGLRQRLMLSLPERECIRAVLDLIDESIDNWRTRQYDRFQFYSNGIL